MSVQQQQRDFLPYNTFVNAVMDQRVAFFHSYRLLIDNCKSNNSFVALQKPIQMLPAPRAMFTGSPLSIVSRLPQVNRVFSPISHGMPHVRREEIPRDFLNRKRTSLQSACSDETRSASSGSATCKRPRVESISSTDSPVPSGLGGERRLRIDFISVGEVKEPIQYFGKSGSFIPDGLSGTHEMYSQKWKFEVTHEQWKDIVVINWKVTSSISGKVTSVTETPMQALERQKKGNTICSVVMRKALEQRVQDIEEEIRQNPEDEASVAGRRGLITELRPHQRNEGILFFGLRHRAVQIRPELKASGITTRTRIL